MNESRITFVVFHIGQWYYEKCTKSLSCIFIHVDICLAFDRNKFGFEPHIVIWKQHVSMCLKIGQIVVSKEANGDKNNHVHVLGVYKTIDKYKH